MAYKLERVGDGAYLLDITGYGCPHVQVYTDKALQDLASGERLTVRFDNPSSGESILFMCETEGHELVGRDKQGGTFTWTIAKA
ncbi:sulfurtransferase TusA family protein [Solimonas variicoloris]|uniref:sulfurtransferase TusA family protein n=1 Tax=Solimonas variicoloris TaxID=254408 RepID=UPI0003A92264|nr:sulfurtransferase TusA family protein [Solimonas variicoloris]